MTNPLGGSTPTSEVQSPTGTHELIYRILLGVFGGVVLCSGGLAIAVLRSNPRIQRWVLIFLACCYVAVFLGSYLVLAFRILKPRHFRWVTLAWNIVMLLFVPFGTALGIYGIAVLDKAPSPEVVTDPV